MLADSLSCAFSLIRRCTGALSSKSSLPLAEVVACHGAAGCVGGQLHVDRSAEPPLGVSILCASEPADPGCRPGDLSGVLFGFGLLPLACG